MPGIPLMLWGEEQGFYVLDNTADNYVFGRQAMSASLAWETHGCYQLGAHQYYGFDDEKAKQGCNDPWNSKDHRDPSHPLRNVVKAMLQMRENYPVLNDGMFLQSLSKQTRFVQLPGSNHTQTELGMWSTVRDRFAKIQDLSGIGQGNQSVWLVYQNDNTTIDYMFDCGSNETALIAPYDTGTTVKNLFYPYEEIKLKKGPKKLGINGSREFNGCLDHLELRPWEFKAFVPKDKFVANGPMITNFVPGHDERIVSLVAPDQKENVAVEFHFSTPMDCHSVSSSIEITSTTADGSKAKLDNSTAKCETISNTQVAGFVGSIPTQWTFKAQLTNVANGIHSVTIKNATASNGKSTNSIDHFIFRIGQSDNPIVFPRSANYTTDLLHRDENGGLFVSHKAAGAEMWRYTLDWSHFSDWMPYTGGDSPLAPKIWTGTTRQGWDGEHVIVQYYSKGSSNHIQHGDLDQGNQSPRRFPHLFVHGPFNQFGFDGGISNSFRLDSDGLWRFDLMTEWPTEVSINEWGINPDGKPDSTGAFGDVDRDGVLDRMPPSSLASSILNLTSAPPLPNLGWTVVVNDGTYQYKMVPVGNIWTQIIIFIVSWVAPIASATLSVWAFMGFFYSVKFNKIGIKSSKSIIPAIKSFFEKAPNQPYTQVVAPAAVSSVSVASGIGAIASVNRRTVLIATLEYDIEDWIGVKIKIGGLGTMAQLMGKSLGHQDLIWVVPCVGDIEYPEATGAEPMQVTILGQVYDVEVQYHQLRNMTYVLLDAPVFRKQTKTEPYPARMDDLDSAVYYSTWNQCIAQAITRFSVDLYHINDYHGAAAPLYLLPEQTVPACLSLHNAEFQGLWPLKNPKQFQEVCSVFNLPSEIVEKYVQFGDVFNLLHAGSSYIRIHQKGFGAVGVSKKYGDRSHARYPIFWGLKKIGQLPNPDPTDVAEWTGSQDTSEAVIDEAFEAGRPELKRQAQEWAGLIQDPEADLFVFVGRWSMQKGIDLIADVMPAVLEDNPKVQLICVGPVIDLYGKFAALKLDVLMKKYKGRVYSKPEFTALPPYIFSGAEFALIPSRDEPFGLVAVEFGRKGALSIGSRVGGLGQMPGWWFTVESMTTSHMLRQFKSSIKEALASSHKTRRTMRARSAKQRFPVAAWIEQLEALQSTAIKLHQKEAERPHTSLGRTLMSGSVISLFEPSRSRANSNTHSRNSSRSRVISGAYSRPASGQNTPTPGTPRLRPLSGTPPNGTPPLVHPAFNAVYGSGGLASESDLSLDQPFRGHRRRATSRGYFDLRDTPDLERGRDSPDFEHEARYDSDTSRPGSAMTSRTLFLSPGQARGASRSPRLRAESMSGQDIPLDSENLLGISIQGRSHPASTLSLSNIVGDKTDYQLQKIDPDFTDSKGEYYKAFEQKLEKLTGDNSEDAFCIEEYLKKSEREWYGNFKNAKLGRSKSPNPSLLRRSRPSSLAPTVVSIHDGADSFSMEPLDDNDRDDEWLLGDGYVPPKGIKLWMQRRIGDWPIYSFFLAFGQIIAANSYQITLLTGTAGPNAEKIYITGAIYIATSFCWWIMFRMLKSVYVLSIPFFFYGGAFLFLAFVPFTTNQVGTEWLQNVATGMYAAASSSGSIYFALNFGDEGGGFSVSKLYYSGLTFISRESYKILGL
jgi:alpha-1,3-glucan synthase